MRATTTIKSGPKARATRRPPGRADSHRKWTNREGPVNDEPRHLHLVGTRRPSSRI